jgi:hypothetical protein
VFSWVMLPISFVSFVSFVFTLSLASPFDKDVVGDGIPRIMNADEEQ